MFSKIKITLGAIVTALIAFLGLAVKYQSNRADNAEEEAKEANKLAEHESRSASLARELNDIKSESVKKGVSDAEFIQQIKDNGRRPESFSSNSLLDD